MLNGDDLRALIDAAAKATPGPWYRCGITEGNGVHYGVADKRGAALAIGLGESSSDACCNRDYIAAASPGTAAHRAAGGAARRA